MNSSYFSCKNSIMLLSVRRKSMTLAFVCDALAFVASCLCVDYFVVRKFHSIVLFFSQDEPRHMLISVWLMTPTSYL